MKLNQFRKTLNNSLVRSPFLEQFWFIFSYKRRILNSIKWDAIQRGNLDVKRNYKTISRTI